MRERAGLILKIACYLLVALLLYQFATRAIRWNRASVTIPELPTLSDAPDGKGTNAAPATAKGTNTLKVASGTNLISSTNVAGTNVANVAGTNAPKSLAQTETNAAPHVEAVNTNASPVVIRPEPNKDAVIVSAPVLVGTNRLQVLTESNAQAMLAMAGTNPAARRPTERGSNAASPRDIAMAGANPRSSPARKTDLPPEIKARVDRIIESEILGQVVRPQPMALIGIVGNSAILRTPSGQTGLVKEGDELGGVKLVQIGINRVLVEEQGQKKELTVFSGFGSESLLSKQKETRDETTNK